MTNFLHIPASDILRVRLSIESKSVLRINELSEACARGDNSSSIKVILAKYSCDSQQTQFQSMTSKRSSENFGVDYEIIEAEAGECSLYFDEMKEFESVATPQLTNDNLDIYSNDVFDRSALHYAVLRGRTSVFKTLIQNGFEKNIFDQDSYGYYPLHLAVQSKSYEIASLLIDNLASSKDNAKLINCVTAKNETALMLLCQQISGLSDGNYQENTEESSSDDVELLTNNLETNVLNQQIELIDKMIKHGIDINIPDSRGSTALFYATNVPTLLKKLIQNGANIHHKDGFSRNALFNTVYSANVETCQLLINSGIDVNLKDSFEHTPLMLAACFADFETCKILIENGADVNATFQQKHMICTPLVFAIRHESYKIAKLLVQNGAKIDIDLKGPTHVRSVGISLPQQPIECIWDLLLNEAKHDFLEHDDNSTTVKKCDSDFEMVMEDLMVIDTTELDDRFAQQIKTQNFEKLDLIEIMRKIETNQKYQALLASKLVEDLNVPLDILQMISRPLKWQHVS